MNKPINFDKINDADFQLFGNNFRIDLDPNGKPFDWVWVFGESSVLGDYVVLFVMKWEHNCYSMKKCLLGEGDTGDWIFQDQYLSKMWAKTKGDFVEHIVAMIDSAIKTGEFKN